MPHEPGLGRHLPQERLLEIGEVHQPVAPDAPQRAQRRLPHQVGEDAGQHAASDDPQERRLEAEGDVLSPVEDPLEHGHDGDVDRSRREAAAEARQHHEARLLAVQEEQAGGEAARDEDRDERQIEDQERRHHERQHDVDEERGPALEGIGAPQRDDGDRDPELAERREEQEQLRADEHAGHGGEQAELRPEQPGPRGAEPAEVGRRQQEERQVDDEDRDGAGRAGRAPGHLEGVGHPVLVDALVEDGAAGDEDPRVLVGDRRPGVGLVAGRLLDERGVRDADRRRRGLAEPGRPSRREDVADLDDRQERREDDAHHDASDHPGSDPRSQHEAFPRRLSRQEFGWQPTKPCPTVRVLLPQEEDATRV